MEKMTKKQKQDKQKALNKYKNDYAAKHYKRCNISFTMDIYNAMQGKATADGITVIDYIRKLIIEDITRKPDTAPQPIQADFSEDPDNYL